LKIHNFKITDDKHAGASYIGEFLKEDCILRVLSIHNNPIGDEGISLIIKGIQQNTYSALTELRVQKCGLSVKGKSNMHTVVNIPT